LETALTEVGRTPPSARDPLVAPAVYLAGTHDYLPVPVDLKLHPPAGTKPQIVANLLRDSDPSPACHGAVRYRVHAFPHKPRVSGGVLECHHNALAQRSQRGLSLLRLSMVLRVQHTPDHCFAHAETLGKLGVWYAAFAHGKV